jgi:A/G-specific adenine glycosylase
MASPLRSPGIHLLTIRTLNISEVRAFRRKVYDFFTCHGRDLPWRHTRDPYHILVSEIMLQQTQVDRVAIKYSPFIARFPDATTLAAASVKEILAAWAGLGYNRRALRVRGCAQAIVERYNGEVPTDPAGLASLPGIGKATAASIAAFAFNAPVVFIETNIRAVFIHEFYPSRDDVDDAEIAPLVERTLDKRNPCRWYSALMDYGTHLKKAHANPARRSAHHVRQSRFDGSDRQVRGAVLRELSAAGGRGAHALHAALQVESGRLAVILQRLEAEGFIACVTGKYTLR